MVCLQCARKLEKSDKLATPEFTKGKSDYNLSSSSSADSTSKVKVNQNMILNKRKFAFDPMATKCGHCNGRVENRNKFCLTCAYTKGICEMCGVKMTDTKSYKFTDVDPKDAKRKKRMGEKTKEISRKIIEDKNLLSAKRNRDMEQGLKPITRNKELIIRGSNNIEEIKNTSIVENKEASKPIPSDNSESDQYDEVIQI